MLLAGQRQPRQKRQHPAKSGRVCCPERGRQINGESARHLLMPEGDSNHLNFTMSSQCFGVLVRCLVDDVANHV